MNNQVFDFLRPLVNLSLTIDQKPYGVHLVSGYNLPKGQGALDDQVASDIYRGIDETIDQIVSEHLKRREKNFSSKNLISVIIVRHELIFA